VAAPGVNILSTAMDALERPCCPGAARHFVCELRQAKEALEPEAHVLTKYLTCDVLHIDEIGYAQAEPVQVGLFFTLMQRRHKKKPTLITSNLGFSEWGSFLKNDHLTAALIDRLTESSHVINMKQCVSLRAKLSLDP
jgi:DNA replication protein DnaC